MRGRHLFKFFYPLLNLCVMVLRIIPRNIVKHLWVFLDLLPGIIGVAARFVFLKRLCSRVGNNVFIGRNVEVVNWQNIVIGNNVSIHKGCYIDASGGLEIGNDVSIAHASSILTFDHSWANETLPIRSNPLIFKPVKIKDDVWIGCGCRVLCGTTIGTRSIVAAGAVVTKNVDEFSLVAGIPARFVKRLQV